MIPVRTDWCNFTMLGPTPDIGDLPIRKEQVAGRTVLRSYWKPSAQELLLLNKGGTVELGIHSPGMPPVSIGVTWTPNDGILTEKWT